MTFLKVTFCSDDCSNSFGHGGCQTFELLHLDAGLGVGNQSFQFYKAGRMVTPLSEYLSLSGGRLAARGLQFYEAT